MPFYFKKAKTWRKPVKKYMRYMATMLWKNIEVCEILFQRFFV